MMAVLEDPMKGLSVVACLFAAGQVYFGALKNDPLQNHLYRIGIDGSAFVQPIPKRDGQFASS